jgi:hypothetical protein
MDEPFRIGCGRCGEGFETPEQYIDHLLVKEHAPPELLSQLRDGSGYAAFARELTQIQEHGARGQMPPNSQRLDLDDVPDEVRKEFAEVERRDLEAYAATLTTAELIELLRRIGDMMARMASIHPSASASQMTLAIRAAEIRLRELGAIELAKVSDVATAQLIANLREEIATLKKGAAPAS